MPAELSTSPSGCPTRLSRPREKFALLHLQTPTARFDITSFSFQLFAVRDIEAEEELTISYVATTDTTKERQTNLESYGFQCSCAACLAPSESDATRA
ncbi:hypothetical protein B0H14DRAFT_3852944 [Mycena olivaceomarginata]|nr:hypothetical protein B0H14DRAFT_3852944 [Mycena olivaceomarginata]